MIKKYSKLVMALTLFTGLSITPVSAQILPTDILQAGYGAFTCDAATPADTAFAVTDLSALGTLYMDPSNRITDLEFSADTTQIIELTRSAFEDNQLAGQAIDIRTNEIYVSSTATFDGSATDAKIYRISRDGATVTLVATLPGTVGVGWMELDQDHDQIYATDFDTGLINIVDLTLGDAQTGPYTTFAPSGFVADANDNSLAPIGSNIYGVGYNSAESRLYYFLWDSPIFTSTPEQTNQIRSVAVNADGTINAATDIQEYILPPLASSATSSFPGSQPVSDIDFSADGQIMLLGEQGINTGTFPTNAPHQARVIEVRGGTGSWVGEPVDKHRVGITEDTFNGNPIMPNEVNSRGGVSFFYEAVDSGFTTGAEDFITYTADALPFRPTTPTELGRFVYGIGIHDITLGGSVDDSIKVDLDFETVTADKNVYGDIDIRLVTPVQIGDFVFLDNNSNGIQDAGDTAIAGVTVSLVDPVSGAVIEIDTTGADGLYNFSVAALSGFTLKLQTAADFAAGGPLDGLILTTSNVGADDAIDSDAVDMAGDPAIMGTAPSEADVTDFTFDFGFVEQVAASPSPSPSPSPTPAPAPTVRIGDFVWFDGDRDGSQVSSTFALADVVVNLFDAAGALVSSTVTDASGNYFFDVAANTAFSVKLDASNFAIGGALDGTSLTLLNATTDDLDSDATLMDGVPSIMLTSPSVGEDLSYDFGFEGNTELSHQTILDSLLASVSALNRRVASFLKRNSCGGRPAKLASNSESIYSALWANVWNDLRLEEVEDCPVVSNVEVKTEIRKGLRKLTKLNNRLTNNTCLTGTDKQAKYKKKLRKYRKDIRNSLKDFPDTVHSCK